MPAIETYRRLGVPLIAQTFDAAEALAGMGRVEEGRALLDRTKEAPAMMRLPWPAAAAARAAGLLSAAEGDLERAERELEEAVSIGERLGWPLELGRSLLALGTVQRQARKKRVARTTLERAVEVFSRLGAKPWAERARRELGRIGGRKSRAGRAVDDRGRDRRARRRRPLEQGGRAGSPSEPEDRRVEPLEGLPQARCPLPDRARRQAGHPRLNPGKSPVVACGGAAVASAA